MYDGMINVYKEKGFTSHDVVAKLRGILHMKKIGHTGTLDPDATGVLPVCLGKGTKLCDMITDHDKTYDAELLFGVTTDTQDISGKVLSETAVNVTEEQARAAAEHFVGDYMQLPPMYSAIKIGGKKLYELAREGKEVERKPRHVVIHALRIISIDLPYMKISVDCSKGTYIRTLCQDIGELLGCGACMTKLVRTKVGRFDLEQALTLNEIEAHLKQTGGLDSVLIPIEDMLADYASVCTVDEQADKMLANGNKLSLEQINATCPVTDGKPVRVYNSQGMMVALYAYDLEASGLKNIKMFN